MRLTRLLRLSLAPFAAGDSTVLGHIGAREIALLLALGLLCTALAHTLFIAALSLGAAAVQMGSAFVSCAESGAPEGYKRALLVTGDEDDTEE